jgi:hypothetical protein
MAVAWRGGSHQSPRKKIETSTVELISHGSVSGETADISDSTDRVALPELFDTQQRDA